VDEITQPPTDGHEDLVPPAGGDADHRWRRLLPRRDPAGTYSDPDRQEAE
jgi:hypothetical protein